jgi:hypothetical protein
MEWGSLSFSKWCAHRDISRSMGYKLVKSGLGPRLHYVGKKPMVSRQADFEWISRMEQRVPTKATAEPETAESPAYRRSPSAG